ncbi:MAG: ABC transporter substrate-binding protein [Alphaproteobacteria bacterium]
MRKLIIAILGAFVGLAALSAQTTPVKAAGPDHLDCAYPFWVGFAPLHLANELGYFKEQGLTVKEIIDDDRSNALAAMARGDIDCYFRSVGEYQGRPRTPETQGIIIGTIDVSDGGDGVVTDASVKSICDLKGKTVASEPNLPSTLIIQMALKKQCGLSIDQVNLMDIASSDAVGVFSDPNVMAVGAYEPVLTKTVEVHKDRGAYIIVSSKDYPNLITDTIIARTDNLKSQPEKYVKLLRGIYKAVDYFRKNPDKAIPIMAKRFDLSPAEFKEVLQGIRYYSLKESVDLVGMNGKPGTLHKIFADVMQLNIENNAADVQLKAEQQIDNSIITKVWQTRTE